MSTKLIRNHSSDERVSHQWPAEGVDFAYRAKRGKGRGSLQFGEGVVRIGTNGKGVVKSFVCPQVDVAFDVVIGGKDVAFRGLGEVEVDYIGGSIDPVSGQGRILFKGVEWRFWGDYVSTSENWTVTKSDAAIIPVGNTKGGRTLEALSEAIPEGDSFVSFSVRGVQKRAKGIQSGMLQEMIIEVVNEAIPGLTSGGTVLRWNINARPPVPVVGDEYVDLAHALHMGSAPSGQAL